MRYLLTIALILRLALSLLPAFEVDQNAFRYWSARLVEIGPSHFYSKEVFTDNPLGYLYVLWGVGEFKEHFLPSLSYFSSEFEGLLKLPANLADIATGILIYLVLKKKLKERQARWGFLLYALNPALVFNSAVFGQFDGIAILLMFLAAYLMLSKKRPEQSAVAYALAWIVKPQAIFFAPALGLLLLVSTKPVKWLMFGAVFVLTVLLVFFPFFPKNPLYGPIYVNQHSINLFSCTTCFGFNLWGIWGNWQNDLARFLGLPLVWWGIILTAISLVPIFFKKPFSIKFKEPYFYLVSAVSIMAFFILLTRMHERYFLYLLPFLLTASLIIKSKFLLFFYLCLSLLMLFGLYLPYTYYNEHMTLTSGLAIWLSDNFSKLSFVGFISFDMLLIYELRFFRGLKRHQNDG